ncbi:immunity protein Imm33 domain-containing protein [Pseudoduganella sp. S-14]|uniref:immunity protein Imm33 domain-containing protein n=1 Tax=Pseudoduganella sp. S-14 TaxID=3404065 RepID=UPI003CF8604D
MLKNLLRFIFIAAFIGSAAAAQDYSTTQCTKYGQAEFVFSVDDGSLGEKDAQWFRETLEEMVAAGEKFKAGETLLVGPVPLKLEAAEDGKLRVLEPDMKTIPFKFVPSVTRTLKIVRRQRYAADSLGATKAIRFAPFHHPLMVTPGALQAPSIIMIRAKKQDGVTGWVLTELETKSKSKDDLEVMSVYEAMLKRPDIMDFLALPEQFSVVVSGRKKFEIFKDGTPVEPRKGSYLDMRSKQ